MNSRMSGSVVGSKLGAYMPRTPTRTVWPGGAAAARGGRTMKPVSAMVASTSILFTFNAINPRSPDGRVIQATIGREGLAWQGDSSTTGAVGGSSDHPFPDG